MKRNAGQGTGNGLSAKGEHKVGDTLAGVGHAIASVEQRVEKVLVDAEHKVETAISNDVDHTIRDMNKIERGIGVFGRVHPNVWMVIQVLAFVVFVALLLAAQAHFGQNRIAR